VIQFDYVASAVFFFLWQFGNPLVLWSFGWSLVINMLVIGHWSVGWSLSRPGMVLRCCAALVLRRCAASASLFDEAPCRRVAVPLELT
jgi:hypothetical protein